jgi:hypothetical protein
MLRTSEPVKRLACSWYVWAAPYVQVQQPAKAEPMLSQPTACRQFAVHADSAASSTGRSVNIKTTDSTQNVTVYPFPDNLNWLNWHCSRQA